MLQVLQARTRKVRSEKLRKDISELRVKAKRLESPATFAKSAKLERQANVKERELAAVQAVSPSEAEFVKGINTVKVSAVQFCCLTFCFSGVTVPSLASQPCRRGPCLDCFGPALDLLWTCRVIAQLRS